MRVRKNVWGGIFTATIVFTAVLLADILTNKAAVASAIYANTNIGTAIPAEVLFVAVLSLPIIATVSGVQFLRYYVKCRKRQTA